jgi:hypothetical protein
MVINALIVKTSMDFGRSIQLNITLSETNIVLLGICSKHPAQKPIFFLISEFL